MTRYKIHTLASPKKAMAWWLSAVLSKVGSTYVAVIHFKIGFLRLPHFILAYLYYRETSLEQLSVAEFSGA